MASLLDPYTPDATQPALPSIPGLDQQRMQSPALVQHDAQVQSLQSEQMKAQQEALAMQHQQAQREAQTGIATDIADPTLRKGWNELTPEQQQGQQAKYSPMVWGELPTMHNTAVSTATGRPVGASVQGSEQVSGEVPGGFKFQNIQPTATEGATGTFSTLAPQEQGMAQEIANYRFPYQAISRIPGPQRMRVLNAASEVNPDFDANQYQTRQGVMKSFASGPDADNLKSANTLVGHIDGLLTAGEQLHNRAFQPWNYLANTVESANGNPAQVTFKTKADAVASELAKLFKGMGAGNVQEIKEWRENLSPNLSPDQIRASAQSILDLMNSRVDALKTKYVQGMGTDKGAPDLSDQSKQILQKHGLIEGGAAAAPAQQAQSQPPQIPIVSTRQQFDQIPSGTSFIGSDGKRYKKP